VSIKNTYLPNLALTRRGRADGTILTLEMAICRERSAEIGKRTGPRCTSGFKRDRAEANDGHRHRDRQELKQCSMNVAMRLSAYWPGKIDRRHLVVRSRTCTRFLNRLKARDIDAFALLNKVGPAAFRSTKMFVAYSTL
jgi:hypothetical protein